MIFILGLILIPFLIYLSYKVFKDPLWGILVVLVMRPIEPLLGLESIQLGRLMGLLSFLIWFIYLFSEKSAFQRLRSSALLKYLFPLFLFLFLGTISWITSEGADKAFNGFLNVLLLGLLSLMLENVITSKSRLSMLLFVFSLSGAIASLPAAAYMVGYDLYSLLGLDSPMAARGDNDLVRAGTIGGGANTLGNLARTGVWASLVLLLFDRKKWIFIVTFLLISLLGLIISASRTNFYGILIAMVIFAVFVVYYSKINILRTSLVLISLSFLGYFAYMAAPKGTQNRLLNIEESEYADERLSSRNNFRKEQQEDAINLFWKHPLTGSGLYRSRTQLGTKLAFHDTFSVVVGETGLFGIIPSLVLLISVLLLIFRNLKDKATPTRIKLYLSAFFAVIIALNVMGFFGGLIFLFDRSFWIFLGISYATINLYKSNLL